jgi:hypothetical protein
MSAKFVWKVLPCVRLVLKTSGLDLRIEKGGDHMGLFIGDHLAQVGDVFFDSGDFFRPGDYAVVGDSGGVFSFGFGEGIESVLELLLKRGAGHRGRVSPAHRCECAFGDVG